MRLQNLLLWRRRRRERDLEDEIASHLALAAHDRVAEGQDPRSAYFAARKEFGNVTLTREATRLSWGGRWIERLIELARDVRYAVRLLRGRPAYSGVVVAVLALGIGINLIAFGLFQALALTPLGGVRRSADLQFFVARTTDDRTVALPYPDYRFLRERVRSFESLAGSYVQGWTLGRGEDVSLVFGELVSGNYFEVLGVGATLGRPIDVSDDVRGGQMVAVISDNLWRSRFNADPEIVGRSVEVDAMPMTIIGVAAPLFRGSAAGLATDIFVPYAMQPALDGGVDPLEDPKRSWVYAFGRRSEGVTIRQARAEAAVLSAQLADAHPLDTLRERAALVPIWQSPQGAQTYMLPAVSLMGVMSAMLLVVVCANVAGLVLVRSLSRRKEIATRMAVGASRGRVVRLLLIETLLLAIPGAVIGWQLPALLAPYLEAAQPTTVVVPLHFNTGGPPAAMAAALLAVLSALLAGLVPALRASRVDVITEIRAEGAVAGSGGSRMRTALVVLQVAISVMLLVVTALVTRSLTQARRADPGFDAQNVTNVMIAAPPGEDITASFYRGLMTALRADPAIESASLMKNPLLNLIEMNRQEFVPEGHARGPEEDFGFLLNVIAPDHFRTLRIPLVAGRDFDDRDDEQAPAVAIVNETLARRYWGSAEAAVGKRLRTRPWTATPQEWCTIVGVAADIKYLSLTEQPRPHVYFPHAQALNGFMIVQARGRTESAALVDIVRRHVHAIDASAPILQASTLSEATSFGVGIYDLTARALAIIGLAAMSLMALGIYGLIAFTVQQSTHEIGLRLAIGAPSTHILRRFVARGLVLAAAGVGIGAIASLWASRFISQLLYGVSATDTASFAGAATAVVAVAFAASLVPAWRGSRLDPLVALRRL